MGAAPSGAVPPPSATPTIARGVPSDAVGVLPPEGDPVPRGSLADTVTPPTGVESATWGEGAVVPEAVDTGEARDTWVVVALGDVDAVPVALVPVVPDAVAALTDTPEGASAVPPAVACVVVPAPTIVAEADRSEVADEVVADTAATPSKSPPARAGPLVASAVQMATAPTGRSSR